MAPHEGEYGYRKGRSLEAAQGAKGRNSSPEEGIGGSLMAAEGKHGHPCLRGCSTMEGAGKTCTLSLENPTPPSLKSPHPGRDHQPSAGPRAKPLQKASLPFLSLFCPIFGELSSEEEGEERRREIGVEIGSDPIILTKGEESSKSDVTTLF